MYLYIYVCVKNIIYNIKFIKLCYKIAFIYCLSKLFQLIFICYLVEALINVQVFCAVLNANGHHLVGKKRSETYKIAPNGNLDKESIYKISKKRKNRENDHR